MKKSKKRLILYMVSVLAVIIAILSVLLIQFNAEYKKRIEEQRAESIIAHKNQYQTITYAYRQLAQLYYNQVIDNTEILDIIWRANNANEKEREVLRERLIALCTRPYESMVSHDFRQYHYVLKDNTSFLRMHKQDRYGDDLKDIRDSVRIANADMHYVEGFEEGRVMNGYRFEYPLTYQGEHIGCVEISMSFESISHIMKELFNTKTAFLMNKAIIDEKVWDDVVDTNYSKIYFTPHYLYDKATQINVEAYNQTISSSMCEEISEKILMQETFLVSYQNSKDQCVLFLNIENIANQHAGYLMFVNDCDYIAQYRKAYVSQLILLIIAFLLIVFMIVFLVINRMRIEKITYYDNLTGILNRNRLVEYIQKEMDRYERYDLPVSIILFDVDGFKPINDQYGHLIGDKLLRDIADNVQNSLRKTDLFFRYGGDEFLILMPNTAAKDAMTVAHKLRKKIGDLKMDYASVITLSLGVVSYKKGLTVEQFIHKADDLLYKAKSSGKNCVEQDQERS